MMGGGGGHIIGTDRARNYIIIIIIITIIIRAAEGEICFPLFVVVVVAFKIINFIEGIIFPICYNIATNYYTLIRVSIKKRAWRKKIFF